MAKGDIVNVISAVAASGVFTYQPAAGVEVIIFSAQWGTGAGAQAALSVGSTNGTQKCGMSGGSSAMATSMNALRMGVTNAIYLTWLCDATARDFGVSGVQVK